MQLIKPTIEYMGSFLQMATSLQSEGHWWGPDLKEIEQDFPGYLKKLELAQSGIGLTIDQIPKTEFWILENDLIVGRLNINHELTDSLKIRGGNIGYGIIAAFRNKGIASQALASAIGHAKQIGLTEILMTCDDDNLGSIKVIEKNGGDLKDKVVAPGRTILTRRYTIHC